MNDINIQNIVASTRISDELDVEKLADCIHGSKYNPDQFPGLILHFDKPKTAALIFSSGKVICTGAKKMEEVDYTISTITKKISNIGIEVFDKPEIKIQNIVASTDLNKEFRLSDIAKSLMNEKMEYEPEQFPGLIYRMENLGVVLLLFSSGKLVCTGAKNFEDITNAIDSMREKLTSIGIL